MEQGKKKSRGGLVAVIVIAVLLALVCAAPFLYNYMTPYGYEDMEAMAGDAEELFALYGADDGGRLHFHIDRQGVYRLLLDSDLLKTAAEEAGGRVAVETLNYSLGPESGQLEVFAHVKLFGFLPAPLRAVADVAVEGTETLRIVPREVWYGNRIRIAPERLAKWTGMPELAGGFELSLAEWTEPLRADSVYLEGEGLTITSPLLSRVLDEVAAQNDAVARLVRLYCGDAASPALNALYGVGREDFIRAAGADFAALRAALRDVTAFGAEAYVQKLSAQLEGFPTELNSGLAGYAEARAAWRGLIADRQAFYAAAQLGLRQDYWYKNVTLTASHLLGMEGTPLEDRLPAEWEARVVLMYNVNYDAIVKTSEGNPRLQEPIPGLPMLSELPRDSWASVPKNGNGPFDLTLALRLPSGVPAVVFLTAEDEYGLAVIDEALFAEMRESAALPIYSSGDVVTAPRGEWLCVTGLRDDLPPAYYIGLP